MKEGNARDQRRFLRYEILDYALVGLEDGSIVNAVVVDIGLGGLQLRSKTLLPVGQRCDIQIGQLDGDPVFLTGEIRHTSHPAGSELIMTGVRFSPASHADRLAIAGYVHGVFQRQCDKLLI